MAARLFYSGFLKCSAEESITEDIFGCEDYHASELVEGIHVEVFDFAEDTVVVYATFHVLLLEFHHVA